MSPAVRVEVSRLRGLFSYGVVQCLTQIWLIPGVTDGLAVGLSCLG